MTQDADGKVTPGNTKLQIVLAVIGLVGTLCVAVITNFDKIRRPSNINGGGITLNANNSNNDNAPKVNDAEILQEQLRPIFYERTNTPLTAENKETLDRYAILLNRSPSLIVSIEGHTGEIDPLSNVSAGKDAAGKVMLYLMQKGVDSGRLKVVSYGAERPLKPGESKYNNRVEFKVFGPN